MKNVGILIQNLCSGGAERVGANLSLALSEYYNVYVLAYDARNVAYEYRGELIDMGLPPAKGVLSKALTFVRRVVRLTKLKRKLNLDCVISHLYAPSMVNVLSPGKARKVCCIHCTLSKSNKGKKDKIKYRLLSNLCDVITNVSQKSTEDMILNFSARRDKTKCIRNFCDVETIQLRRREPLSPELAGRISSFDRVLVTCGRLSREKAQWHLIKIMPYIRERVGNVGLAIIGTGQYEEKLKALSRSCGTENAVLFTGHLANPYSMLEKGDLFVLPSHYEGMPMVILEAMACEVPVISCDFDSGAREILAPDTSCYDKAKDMEMVHYGVLVPECYGEYSQDTKMNDSEKKLADAIIQLLADDTKRQQYVLDSHECLDRFSKESITQEWIKIVEGQAD